jgi:hypothetical protein
MPRAVDVRIQAPFAAPPSMPAGARGGGPGRRRRPSLARRRRDCGAAARRGGAQCAAPGAQRKATGSSAGPGRRRPQQRDEAGQAECPAPRGASGAGARPVRSPGLRVRHYTPQTPRERTKSNPLCARGRFCSLKAGVLSYSQATHTPVLLTWLFVSKQGSNPSLHLPSACGWRRLLPSRGGLLLHHNGLALSIKHHLRWNHLSCEKHASDERTTTCVR